MRARNAVLSFGLILTLASCASLPKPAPAYVPPRVDCAANDVPRAEAPEAPAAAVADRRAEVHDSGRATLDEMNSSNED